MQANVSSCAKVFIETVLCQSISREILFVEQDFCFQLFSVLHFVLFPESNVVVITRMA